MTGVYIHIPYCRQKCNYCNFFSVVSRKSAPEMIGAICREIDIRTSSKNLSVETLYLGGGTPSLLDKRLLSQLFDTLNRQFSISEGSEITLEANPDDINPDNLSFWKSIGINRLSIGIQSFRDEDLKYLNRVHSAETAIDCIRLAREFGFPDLTIDLIYGIPTLSDNHWIENLQLFQSLSLPHLSAYALTVEPKTPLFRQIAVGKAKPVDEQQSANQFMILMEFMRNHGYLHYEISNFCKPGHFAKHNVSYWKGVDYYGFGPSAHSYYDNKREWNVSSVTEYLNALNQGLIPSESEELTEIDRYNEYVMTGLRTMWGCDTAIIKDRFGEASEAYFQSRTTKWSRYMTRAESRYTLNDEGKLLADGIASDLFQIEP